MRDKSPAPIISPDGRFEVIVEQEYDRGFYNYYTVLIERATGERLFTKEGEYSAEFAEDGLLTIHFPGFKPNGAQIDPVKLAFRTSSSAPWVPIAMWGIVESVYWTGYENGRKYKDPTPFPWAMIVGLLGSVIALPALGQNILSSSQNAAKAVMALAGLVLMVGALGYVTAHYLRAWMQERIKERKEERS